MAERDPAYATRTAAIMAEVRRVLLERQALIDRADDLGAITLHVKLNAGTNWVRSVTVTEERLCRSRT